MKPAYILALVCLLAASGIHAQVNAYARVTSISSTALSVTAVNESFDVFTAGNQVLVIQMQDNVIGSNTGNNASFGDLSTISSAGSYEVAIISSVQRTAGVPTQININSPLAKTFNTGANSNVQVVSYRLLGSSGYTTVADIPAVAWNGSVGGVVAFRVSGTLTLTHDIHADYAGFRGGTLNSGNAGSCDGAVYISSVNDLYANKGEGIYKATNTGYAAGRGKILNGGGGGSSHNGGGGGGSNITAGGEGGRGYSCSSNAGGLGGVPLRLLVTPERIFMGGGGGAGEANNNYNTAGGNGGGIVIITATQIATTGTGSPLRISANGQTAANVGNDGAGGGGAGGSIILNVQSWNISSTRQLTVSANGGSGGNVTDATAHGGGGGGGQGAVIYSTSIPATNITTSTLNGSGGRNYAGGTFANSGGESDNLGIYAGSFAVLPVKLISFRVEKTGNEIKLQWTATGDEQLEGYEIQRSSDGSSFRKIGYVRSKQEGRAFNAYSFNDDHAGRNKVYYRLLMTGGSGQHKLSHVLAIQEERENLRVNVTPNPVRHSAVLRVTAAKRGAAALQIMNFQGHVLYSQVLQLANGDSEIPFALPAGAGPGNYILLISTNYSQTRLVITVLK